VDAENGLDESRSYEVGGVLRIADFSSRSSMTAIGDGAKDTLVPNLSPGLSSIDSAAFQSLGSWEPR